VTTLDYERDGAAIWAASFATIRAEADLSRVPPDLEKVVVRMIHASGDVTLPSLVEAAPGLAGATSAALRAGRPIWCDAEMVAHGITRRRLPAGNDVRCTLHDAGVAERAAMLATTRSAAAVDLWLDDLDGSVAVVGNAPTALFRLLELLLDGAPRPAAIIGIPVGFIGAAESKVALATLSLGVPFLTVHGRRGGSALAAAAVNALAHPDEIVR
jgi:precorrin-8X/cobalt-precorrin-8 methylmutase